MSREIVRSGQYIIPISMISYIRSWANLIGESSSPSAKRFHYAVARRAVDDHHVRVVASPLYDDKKPKSERKVKKIARKLNEKHKFIPQGKGEVVPITKVNQDEYAYVAVKIDGHLVYETDLKDTGLYPGEEKMVYGKNLFTHHDNDKHNHKKKK